MSKYVYIKSENKVYPTTQIKKDWITIKKELIPIYWLGECYYPPEDYKEFDNFEEILEVGDLLIYSAEGNFFAGLVSSHVREDGTFLINDEDDWIDSVSLSSFNEIYKKNDNTFVKVAHKENQYEENEKWVID